MRTVDVLEDYRIASAVDFDGLPSEDLEIMAAPSPTPPAGHLAAMVETSLFIGERVEYVVEIPDQGSITVYGERHEPIDEGGKVWLRLRPEGHSAWSTDWHKSDFEEQPIDPAALT